MKEKSFLEHILFKSIRYILIKQTIRRLNEQLLFRTFE